MKNKLIIIAVLVGLAGLLLAQTPFKAVRGTGEEVVFGAAGKVYNSGMTAVPDSATALTTSTTYVQFIHCANIDSAAATLTLTDNQSTPKTYFNAISIAANDVLTAHYGPIGLPMVGGIKWSASAANKINCQIVGVQ